MSTHVGTAHVAGTRYLCPACEATCVAGAEPHTDATPCVACEVAAHNDYADWRANADDA